jgi:hypothetical protein
MYAFLKKSGRGLAAATAFALLLSSVPVTAAIETPEAKAEASDAAAMARFDADEIFGAKRPRPGQYLWRKGTFEGDARVVVSIDDQLAYLYRGADLVAVASVSTGVDDHPTPKGIFQVLIKKPMHRSIKYDNAPMPFTQMFDQYGTALHAGPNPGHRASHGCVRLPTEFARKLYNITDIGATVMIGA